MGNIECTMFRSLCNALDFGVRVSKHYGSETFKELVKNC